MKEKKQKIYPRPQKGTFAVTITSNYQTAVFWNDEDRILLLEDFIKYGKKYGLIMHDFILEDTHSHFLLTCDALSPMMASVLRMFSRHYNNRHEKGGNIFQSPFYSYEIITDKQKMEASFYVMYNCLYAGQVNHPKDYKWCSWKYHFNKDKSKIDTGIVDVLFNDLADYEKGFWNYCELKQHCRKIRDSDNRMKDYKGNQKTGEEPPSLGKPYSSNRGTIRNTDEQVIMYLAEMLSCRDRSELSRKEVDEFAIRLFRETGASIRQVHTALGIHFDHSEYIYKKLKKTGWSRWNTPDENIEGQQHSKE
jgi:hypothetical protein